MSTPLGGFGFEVTASIGSAQANLQKLVQQAQQAAQQVQQAFAGANIRPARLRIDTSEAKAAEEAINRVARTVKQVSDRSAIVVRADVSEAQDGLDRLESRARAITNTRINLTARLNNVREAEAAVERMGNALRRAQSGETINLNVRAESVERADAAVKRLEADINRAKAAGARINVNVQTNEQGGSFLREVARGFLQQATPGLATGAAAAGGVVAAQAVVGLTRAMAEGVAAGVRYNASLETSSVQFGVFLGNAEAAAEALQRLRRFADITPFNTDEVIRSGAVFAQVTGGNIQRMERLVQLAGQLAAVNPNPAQGGGLEGATVALREALAGDFTSIRARFDVSAAEIQRLRDAGLAGEALAVALVKVAGGSEQLVKALGDTFTGRLSTAQSHLDKLAGTAAKPLFDVLNAGLAKFNTLFDQSGPRLERLAHILGIIGSAGAAGLVGGPLGAGTLAGGASVGLATGLISSTPPPQPAGGLGAGEQQRQARIAAAQDEANKAKAALLQQEAVIKGIEKALEANAAEARKVTEEYEKQLRPIEAQQRALDALIATNAAQGREIAARARASEGPTETRATNAAQAILLDHERQLLEVRHRRAEITEQIAEAEQSAANRSSEAQISAAETALNAARARAQGEREARQEVLEGLREEIRGRQEARQAALEGMRDYIQAIQEARRETLDAIREEIQARQEARREAIDGIREQIDERRRQYDLEREGIQEARQALQEAFADQERAAERSHSRIMDGYRDQIEALREQSRERERQSDQAQRALDAFEQAERARLRAQSIAGAETAVLRARTGLARREALDRLAEVRAQAAADIKREELQARVAREKEQADRRRSEIQDKIAAIERKARDEDRAYQRERDSRRDAFEAQQRAQQAAERAEDKAERERRRAEDAQIRAAEKADREATKAEQAEIRAAEKADREQTKAENAALQAAERAARAQDRVDQAQLRAAEQAAREADRAAERELRAQEQAVTAQREELAARVAAQEEARAVAALARLREQAELEGRILANQAASLAAIDIAAKAAAEADRIRNEAEGRALADRKAALDDQHAAITRNRDAALVGLEEEAARLAIAKDRAAELALQMAEVVKQTEAAVKAAQAFGRAFDNGATNDGMEAGPSGFSGAPGSNGQAAAGGIGASIANSIRAGLAVAATAVTDWVAATAASISAGFAAAFAGDSSTAGAVTDWTQLQIIDPVEAILEIASPSGRAIKWAESIGEGVVRGLATHERAIVDALEAPWIEVDQRFFPEVERKWRQAGGDHADAYVAGFKASRLPEEIEQCIEDAIRRVQQNERLFNLAGRRAAREFKEGFCDLLSLRDCFAREMEWMIANAEAYGTQVGARFTTGFGQTANVGGGGTGAQLRQRAVLRNGQWQCPPGTQMREEDGIVWCYLGSPAGQSGSRSGSRPQPRALGGPLEAGRPYLVHQDEIIVPRVAGHVIPPVLSRSMLAGGGLASISPRGAVSVTINQTVNALPGMDAQAVAQLATNQAVAAFIDILDDGERRAPDPLSRILPGAVRG